MLEYLVEVWVGGGEQRWSAQTMSVMAASPDAARREVAERLGLLPAAWLGPDPPLELRVPAASPVPEKFSLAWYARRQARVLGSDRQPVGHGALDVA